MEAHNELALDDQMLNMLLSTLGSYMNPAILEMLKSASRSRNEALPLDMDTEDKISFSRLIEVLAKTAHLKSISLLSKPKLLNEVQEEWNDKMNSILGDDGQFLPTRIVRPSDLDGRIFAKHYSRFPTPVTLLTMSCAIWWGGSVPRIYILARSMKQDGARRGALKHSLGTCAQAKNSLMTRNSILGSKNSG